MKTTMIHGLVLLTMLGLGIGCKEEVEPIEDLQSSVYSLGCQIAKTVYKTPTVGFKPEQIIDPEIITLDDGKRGQVGTVTTTTFKYDEVGRVVEVYNQNLSTYYSKKYFYGRGYFIETTEYTVVGLTSVYISSDTIQLNDRGLRKWFAGNGPLLIVYNADNQIIASSPNRPLYTYSYTNKNRTDLKRGTSWVQRNGQEVAAGYEQTVYTYNTDQPALPEIYQFLGAGSRNLVTKEVLSLWQSFELPNKPVYQKTFTYTFDPANRVKRRVVYGTRLDPGWLLEDDLYGVGVTDYEYQNCP